jgi:hypothetical protein
MELKKLMLWQIGGKHLDTNDTWASQQDGGKKEIKGGENGYLPMEFGLLIYLYYGIMNTCFKWVFIY